MKGQTIAINPRSPAMLLLLLVLFAAASALAQVPVDAEGNTLPATYAGEGDEPDVSSAAPAVAGAADLLSAAELQELVGPVALYPDDLLAIVLPASAYPLEIVQAARFLDALENDSSLTPDEAWDESVVALLNYPDVVRMMDDDIEWTWRLGDAVISQQNDVIAAVEAFRDRAYAAGNLKSDDYQKVTESEGVIEIVPVNEEIIYVPYYEPAEVVVYQPRRVYYYYPDPYPVYYYPYPAGYRFRSNYFWGVTTAFHIGWSNHFLHVYHPTYWGHPYYGYNYGDYYYYRRPSINVYNTWYVSNNRHRSDYRYRDGDYWRPRLRAGSRQDEPRVRNTHYPPNRTADAQSRGGYNASNDRSDRRLPVRDNGRMNLDLRERDANTTRTLRQQTNRNIAGARNDRPAVRDNERAPGTRRADSNRATARGNPPATNGRTVTTRREPANVEAPVNRTQRNRSTANDAAATRSPSSAVERRAGPRPDISFRDRNAENSNLRNPARTPALAPAPSSRAPSAAANRSTRLTDSSRRNAETSVQNRNRSTAPVARQQANRGADAPSNRNSGAERQVTPSQRSATTAPRATPPQINRNADIQRSAPRVSAPQVNRNAGVQRSAPARASAPRVDRNANLQRSAPARSSAPASAPRVAPAPRSTAPSPSRQQRAPGQRPRNNRN